MRSTGGMMKRIHVALLVMLAGGCSEGTSPSPFPGLPPGGPGPGPGANDTGPTTFGEDTDPSGGDGAGECCVANGTPGCNDAGIELCVCMTDASCCDEEWTPRCAGMVDELGCGVCGADDTTEPGGDDTTGASGQDCCEGGPEPGCNDPTIETCVCAELPFCCEQNWDEACAAAADALHCADCGGGGGEETGGGTTGGDDGMPPPPVGMGDCCMPQMAGGCSDAMVQDCVCMEDAYCCDSEWDDICVDLVAESGCGDCGAPPPPPPGTSTCCEPQATAGCDDPLVEACVCLIDGACCDTAWDSLCVLWVDTFGCGSSC